MNPMKPPRPLLAALLACLACSSPRPADPHVWRPPPGQEAESIPGPLMNFGSYDFFSDALKAACPLILSKPNASVVHLQERDPELALRVSTEYRAWLYYTPENKYELSMLTDLTAPGSALRREVSCLLPPNIDDPRYSASSIKYIFLLHNHPFSSELSDRDIHLAAAMANSHGLTSRVGDSVVPLSVVAFFSNSKDAKHPTCDGFYQYIPATMELLKWLNTDDHWRKDKVGTVHWTSATKFIITKD